MAVGFGEAKYVQTDIGRECQKCKYAKAGGFLCSEEKMQKNDKVPTDPETGLKIVHPTMGCCGEWNPGDGVDLMQKPPSETMSERFVRLAKRSKK